MLLTTSTSLSSISEEILNLLEKTGKGDCNVWKLTAYCKDLKGKSIDVSTFTEGEGA